jgi:hypothetical protein
MPSFTGSSPTPNTIGIVAVAVLAARVVSILPALAITATRRRTNSAITAGSVHNEKITKIAFEQGLSVVDDESAGQARRDKSR